MNKETKTALMCAAKLRQVLTDIVEKLEQIEFKHGADFEGPYVTAGAMIEEMKKLLRAESLYERVYPLDPMEGETLEQACRRVVGPWIFNEVMDKARRL